MNVKLIRELLLKADLVQYKWSADSRLWCATYLNDRDDRLYELDCILDNDVQHPYSLDAGVKLFKKRYNTFKLIAIITKKGVKLYD